MVAVTRSKTRLGRDWVRKRFSNPQSVTEKMIDKAIQQRQKHFARRGLLEDNAFAVKWLPNVDVPIERTLVSGLSPYIIDSMNSVIRAMKSVVNDHCLMAGGYPTFLLGKTTKFSDVDFFLIVDAQEDYYSFYTNFAKLIEEQLDPYKNWKFEAYCHLMSPYSVRVGDVSLSEKSSISFVTTEVKEKEDYPNMEMQVLKLKTNGVNVADFCFFIQSRLSKKQTLRKESVIDSLSRIGEGYEYDRAIDEINNTFDTCFAMNIARFDGGLLHCYDVSGIDVIEQVDKKCLPIFIRKGSEGRKIKYQQRVSRDFKRHVTAMRRLVV